MMIRRLLLQTTGTLKKERLRIVLPNEYVIYSPSPVEGVLPAELTPQQVQPVLHHTFCDQRKFPGACNRKL